MSRKESSLMASLRRFFADNPDEELSYRDIAAKFDTTVEYARDAVKLLKDRGELESIHVIRLPSKGRAS